MSQVTNYSNEETEKKVRAAAESYGISVSKWIAHRIQNDARPAADVRVAMSCASSAPRPPRSSIACAARRISFQAFILAPKARP